MSPREQQVGEYTCDHCSLTQAEPIHSAWFQVSRPEGVVARHTDDWWQEDRYFCSLACLRARISTA